MKAAPSIEIVNLPTKIQHLDQLTKELGGPQLYIKRDDKTEYAFDGGKVRKLELFMADAVNKGAKLVITSGKLRSNHIRLTVSAAIHFGLKPIIVITESDSKVPQDYYMLNESLGAELHFVQGKDDMKQEVGKEKVKELKQKYEKEGMKSYIIPQEVEPVPTGFCNILDISKQIMERELKINYIVKAVESTCSFGILVLANKLFNTGLTPIGISVTNNAEQCRKQISKRGNNFGFDVKIGEEDIKIFNSSGCNYNLPKEHGVKAIKLLANKEAIFVDHYHTGKAMAGLFNLIKKRYFKKDDGVLFLHTGELPALFALENQLL